MGPNLGGVRLDPGTWGLIWVAKGRIQACGDQSKPHIAAQSAVVLPLKTAGVDLMGKNKWQLAFPTEPMSRAL